MITKWELVPSPCDRDKNRYKLLLSSVSEDLSEIVTYFNQDVGKPFTPLSQEFNYAIYIYNLTSDKKTAAEKFLKSKCQKGKIDDTSKGKDLEEILEMVAEFGEKPVQPHKEEKPKEAPVDSAPKTEKQEIKKEDIIQKAPLRKDTEAPKLRLNLRYVFDEFVVGSNNRFVHAAAWAVSQNPGKTYNPLFIYGGVGLGKTHIMQAIGNTIKDKNPSAEVRYITTEKFTSEVIEAIKSGKLTELREHYRRLDLLLVDDIQFLSEAESTQEEFFHTFNILHENQKQIVITSDKPPKKLSGIEDRLQSRFEWGLIADIKPPDLETRVAILKKKEKHEGIELDDKILIYIASKLKSNIRELEGFLKRLKAYSTMTNMPVDFNLVKDLMGELLPEIGVEEKKEVVAEKVVEIPRPVLPEVKQPEPEIINEEKIEIKPKDENIPIKPEQEPQTQPASADAAAAESEPEPEPEPEPELQHRESTPKTEKPAEEVVQQVVKEEQTQPPVEVKKDMPAAPKVEPVEPQADVQKPAPVKPVVQQSVAASEVKDEYDSLSPVEVCFFYPEGYEKEFIKMKEVFKEVIKKHKLKFRFYGVFEKSYALDKKINYSLFAQLCKTNNLSIAVLLGPPPVPQVSEDDFINMLTTVCEANNITLEIIPYTDLTKQYKYLNVALDITLLHKDSLKKQ
ncbi:MAG: chromosomal replication initiator protein DnaA [Elusimicrobia bacterium RIFOXYC2_FULL_34_12]|nr:MAG: chromosomal replication initiator protein DnaA [Elusimicrobia bacterium RIFOXYC2_FULL_34_12]